MPIIYSVDPDSVKGSDSSKDPNTDPNISTQKHNTEKDNSKVKETQDTATKQINTTLPSETTSSYWINPVLKNIPFLSALSLYMENTISNKLKTYLIPWATFITGIIGTRGFYTFGPELSENLSKTQFTNKLSKLAASKNLNPSNLNHQGILNVAKHLAIKSNLNMAIPEETREVV